MVYRLKIYVKRRVAPIVSVLVDKNILDTVLKEIQDVETPYLEYDNVSLRKDLIKYVRFYEQKK